MTADQYDLDGALEGVLHRDLLVHEAFLRRLARRLVIDEARADDLVQETWLAALTSPPAHDGALRAWLGTIARRLAGRSARSRDRRQTRERLTSRPESVESEADAVDRRLDAQTLLIDGLRKLPEAQRIALSMRYADDLAPPAIAERLGVSVDTVKARLRRGLAALRLELDTQHGGDRGAWALALLPAWTPTAESAVGHVAAGGTLVSQGIIMTTTWKMAASVAVALALAGGWWVTRDASTPGLPVAEAPAPIAPDLAPVHPGGTTNGPSNKPVNAPGERVAITQSAPSEPAPPVAAEPDRWLLNLTVTGDFRQPATVLIRTQSDGFVHESEFDVRETFDRPGTKMVDIGALFDPSRQQRPAALFIQVSSADCVATTTNAALARSADEVIAPDAPLEATVRLERGAVFTGRMVASGGEPLETPAILVFPHERGRPSGVPAIMVEPDGEGRFRFVLAENGPHVIAAISPAGRPTTQQIDALVGTRTDLGDIVLEPGEVISGTLHREDRPTGADYNVVVVPHAAASIAPLQLFRPAWLLTAKLIFADDRFEWGERQIATDDTGQFRCPGLAPSLYDVSCRDAPEARIKLYGETPVTTVQAPTSGLRLAFGWTTVEIQISVPTTRKWKARISIHLDGTSTPIMPVSGEVITICAAPEVERGVTIEVDGFQTRRVDFRTPSAGGHLVVPVALVPGLEVATLVLALTGPAPPDGTNFFVQDLGDDSGAGPQQTIQPELLARQIELKNGELTITDIKPGRRRFLIYAAQRLGWRTTMLLDSEVEATLSPGETRRESLPVVTGGTLHFDVHDANGIRAAASCEVRGPDGRLRLVFRAADGHTSTGNTRVLSTIATNVTSQNLAAGRYTVQLSLAGHQNLVREFVIRAGEPTRITEQLVR